LSEESVRFIISEIILGLEALHHEDVIYRDLKPDNVVIDGDGHVKLTDFGLSKEGISETTSTNSFCGSFAYLAPEMLKRQGHNKTVDWYMLGVLIYEMLMGLPPFYHKNR
jgi:serine/threonine protein kinase